MLIIPTVPRVGITARLADGCQCLSITLHMGNYAVAIHDQLQHDYVKPLVLSFSAFHDSSSTFG